MEHQRPVTRSAYAYWSAAQPSRLTKRLAYALVASIAIHVLILSLRFGAPGVGLPGIALPWAERRLRAPELTVRLKEAQRAPKAAASEPLRLRLSTELSLKPVPEPARPVFAGRAFEGRLVQAQPAPALPPRIADKPSRAAAPPRPAPPSRAAAPQAETAAGKGTRTRKAPPQSPLNVLAQRDPEQDTFKVPRPKPARPEAPRVTDSAAEDAALARAAGTVVPPGEDAAQRDAESATRQRVADEAREKAEESARLSALAQQEIAAKQEEARRRELAANAAEEERQARQRVLEETRLAVEAAQRQARELALKQEREAAQRAAEAQARERAAALQQEREAGRLEEARRIEEARQEELRRQEEARRLAEALEAQKRAEEIARKLEIARQQEIARRREEEAELDAKRRAADAAARAREAAERERAAADAAGQRERERLALQAPTPAPGSLSGKELAAKALEQLRTPGGPRDEVLRGPAPTAGVESPRRRSIFGVERDVGLRMYVESWRWKIERNGSLNYRPSAGASARDNPIVTVSIRSDGSLENVLIHRSSGVRELDEAVRRIAQLHAPYSAFPPALARLYDVIEIRRVWSFERTLKILDEM